MPGNLRNLLCFNNENFTTAEIQEDDNTVGGVIYQLNGQNNISESKISNFQLLHDALSMIYEQDEIITQTSNINNRNVITCIQIRLKEQPTLQFEKQAEKIFIDLEEQLSYLHSKEVIVADFLMEGLVYFPQKQKYSLLALPSLIKQDDVLLRKLDFSNCKQKTVKSQWLFNGPSKASDYLALIKNVTAYQNNADLSYESPDSFSKVMRERIDFLPSQKMVIINYLSQNLFKQDDPNLVLDISKTNQVESSIQFIFQSPVLFYKLIEKTQLIREQEKKKVSLLRFSSKWEKNLILLDDEIQKVIKQERDGIQNGNNDIQQSLLIIDKKLKEQDEYLMTIRKEYQPKGNFQKLEIEDEIKRKKIGQYMKDIYVP